MIAKHIPSAASASKVKVDRLYTGPLDSEVATTMSECDSLGPTVVMVSKLLSTTDAESFLAVGRIMSGKLQTSSAVRVLGEGYNPDFDDEDQALSRVGRIYLSGGRYRVEVRSACAGQIVLIEDVADTIIKSATIVAADSEQQEEVFVITHYQSAVIPIPTTKSIHHSLLLSSNSFPPPPASPISSRFPRNRCTSTVPYLPF